MQEDNFISLRTGLVLSFATLVVLVGGTIFATTYFGSARAVRSVSANLVEGAADRAEEGLVAIIDPLYDQLELATEWAEKGVLSPTDVDSARALLVPLLDVNRRIDAIMVADEYGNDLMFNQQGGRLRQREVRRDEWGATARWSEWGSRVAHGEPRQYAEDSDYDPRERPWFEGAVQSSLGMGEPIFATPPYIFPSSALGLTFASARRSVTGRVKVVAFAIRLGRLQQMADDIEVSTSGRIVILSEDGRLLGVPHSVLPADMREEEWLFQFPRDVDIPLLQAANRAYGSRADTTGEPRSFQLGDQTWWSQARTVDLPTGPLIVVVLLPRSDLIDERASIRRNVLAVTGIALALALLAALLLSRRFSRPFEALVRNSDRISVGDFTPGEEVPSAIAEIRTLERAQTRMREGLRDLVKLEEDLEVARQIQTSTLPKALPVLAGWDFAASCQPADETGGDTYDAFGLDESLRLVEDGTTCERAVFVLADATGHGVGPALSVAQLRGMLRGAVRTGAQLSTAGALINDQLTADLPKNRFITAWVGVVHSNGRMRWVSAGQGPLLLYRAADRSTELFNATAPPFGLFRGLEIPLSEPLYLEPGDVFAALTDGFYEALSPKGEEMGTERIGEVLRRHAEASAEELRATLVAAVEEFSEGAAPDDDRTAVVLKRAGL
ncbi:MAG: SpoIIE family protein phosphatase [Acidobacteriota bacterium]